MHNLSTKPQVNLVNKFEALSQLLQYKHHDEYSDNSWDKPHGHGDLLEQLGILFVADLVLVSLFFAEVLCVNGEKPKIRDVEEETQELMHI